MTPPADAGPEVAELIRRLRARPVSSWSHGDREAVMRGVLQDLADLAAEARGAVSHDAGWSDPDHGGGAVVTRRPVPDVGVAALVDQFVVLLREAQSVGVAAESIDPVVAEMARSLSLRW